MSATLSQTDKPFSYAVFLRHFRGAFFAATAPNGRVSVYVLKAQPVRH
jgi:hypothetical protein